MAVRYFQSKNWLVGILLLAVFLRTIQFLNVPPGFYADEAGVGYEAFALWQTGADRWGITLPVYFISWGSGQSVLYSYLMIPMLAVFGLTIFSTRLLSWLIGILTLPLMYVTVKRVFGQRSALMATLLLALMPWHIMISRWALDANLLPFFLLLGAYTIARALDSNSRVFILTALIPFAFALYAYAMAYLVVPIWLALTVWFYRATMLRYWRAWLGAFALFALLASPIALFLLKNFVVHGDIGIEAYMPFGIPLLPISRIAQVSSQALPDRLLDNFLITFSGFQDGEIRNALPGIAPVFVVLIPLALVGVFNAVRMRAFDLFTLWLIASLPLLFPWNLAVNRSNALFIPLIAIGVAGFRALHTALRNMTAQKILAIGLSTLIAVQAIVFAADYFLVYPTAPDVELAFYKGMDRAMQRGLAVAQPTDAVLVTDKILLPYFLTAFYAAYPPADFAHDIRATLANDAINVQSLGRFYFGKDNLPTTVRAFTFVLAKWDDAPCTEPKFVLQTRLWQVGRCDNIP